MKPHRICMTHHLVLGYGLHKHMEVFVSPLAFPEKSYLQTELLVADVSAVFKK